MLRPLVAHNVAVLEVAVQVSVQGGGFGSQPPNLQASCCKEGGQVTEFHLIIVQYELETRSLSLGYGDEVVEGKIEVYRFYLDVLQLKIFNASIQELFVV